MKNYLLMLLCVVFLPLHSADNEIFVDQSGTGANIDLEQLGSSNLIGGSSAVSGTMTALDLDGISMTLDINQIGSNNLFRSDAIDGDNFTGFFEFDGDSNVMDILLNSTGLISADYINLYLDVTGSSNEFDLKIAEDADSSYLDLDWTILGGSNEFDFDIDYANAINFTGSGYSGNTSSDSGYFYMDLDGSSNTFNIIQSSTLARDWLKIETTTSNSNICITQNDGGTATGC